jgi:hypothetical protein
MAGIVQSETLHAFIRKIGYSVGLEYLSARVNDLVNTYVEKGDITYGAWTELVTEKWGRSIEHSADVFRALNLLEVRQRQAYVLWGLDALAVCRVTFTDNEAYERAQRYILATLITLTDGDVFLNCLAAACEISRLRELLVEMVRFKRQRLFATYKLAETRRIIAKIINIDTQPTNRGGASAGKGLSAGRRTAILSERGGPLSADLDLTVSISDDYFRKVLPKRRDWAISVGLLDSTCQLTEIGQRLLQILAHSGLRTPEGAYVVWPLAYELTQLNIVPSSLTEHPMDTWTFFGLTADSFGSPDVLESADLNEAILIDEVRTIYQHYRGLNPTRAPLRSELPVPVAYLAYSGICVAQERARPNLPALIATQRKAARRLLDFRSSKRMEGAILLRG